MSIPSNITSELANLKAQVAAATPLTAATRPTVVAMQLNAVQLVNDVQSALVATSVLDTWVAPTDPVTIISGVLAELTAAQDQNKLALLRGIVGRVASNLNQVPG